MHLTHYPFKLPQNPAFMEYVYFQGLFLPHEIDRLRKTWAIEESKKAEVSGEDLYKDTLRKSEVTFIDSSDDNQWLYRKMAEVSQLSNGQRYGFDLTGFSEVLQLARYGEGDFFDWHLDFGPGGSSNRKLSISVQLSDPSEYEGGDLEFMINQDAVKAPRDRGTVIVFPSFIMHRVTPITRGTRESLVGWVHGPPFR